MVPRVGRIREDSLVHARRDVHGPLRTHENRLIVYMGVNVLPVETRNSLINFLCSIVMMSIARVY